MISTCPACRGSKKVKGLGNMATDCTTCEGAGSVTVDKLVEKATVKPPVVPQTSQDEVREMYKKNEQDAKARLKNANAAYLNKPVSIETKSANEVGKMEKPVIPLNPDIKQALNVNDKAAPQPIHPDDPKLAKIRAQTNKKRYDPMAAQKANDGEPETLDLPLPEHESAKDDAATAKGKANAKESTAGA